MEFLELLIRERAGDIGRLEAKVRDSHKGATEVW